MYKLKTSSLCLCPIFEWVAWTLRNSFSRSLGYSDFRQVYPSRKKLKTLKEEKETVEWFLFQNMKTIDIFKYYTKETIS